jgi:biotin carboxyl carrier protein
MDNRSYEVHVADSDNGHRWVTVGGRLYRTELHRGHGVRANGRTCGENGGNGAPKKPLAARIEMRAPLPGLLVELRVEAGEHVEEQQVVAVLESMKMNLEVRAPRAGVVRELCAAPDQQVAQDAVLAVLSTTDSCSARSS